MNKAAFQASKKGQTHAEYKFKFRILDFVTVIGVGFRVFHIFNVVVNVEHIKLQYVNDFDIDKHFAVVAVFAVFGIQHLAFGFFDQHEFDQSVEYINKHKHVNFFDIADKHLADVFLVKLIVRIAFVQHFDIGNHRVNRFGLVHVQHFHKFGFQFVHILI